jgi:UDP-glucose 4-epimerase
MTQFSDIYQNKSAIVTGGAGFVGSHLVDALLELGAQVTVIDNLQAGKWTNVPQDKAKIVDGDVRDYDLLRKVIEETQPAFVFHLAANANVPNSVQDPRYDYETNSSGSFLVLDAIRHVSPKTRAIITSSAAVYGVPVHLPVDEGHPLAPVSPYGASKLNSEFTAKMFVNTYNVDAVIARLFNTYGPRMPRYVVIDYLHKLRRDPSHLEIIGDGKQIRDLNYVRDSVNGFLTIGAKGVTGEPYNIGSGSSVSVTELAHIMLEQLGLKDTKITYTGQSWKGDVPKFEADITKLRALGYEPRTSLGQGLKQVINWFEETIGPVVPAAQNS